MLDFDLYGGHALDQIFIFCFNGFAVTVVVAIEDGGQRLCRRGPTS
jgi:hypothetical protein